MAAEPGGVVAGDVALPEAIAVRFESLLRSLRLRYHADPRTCAAAFGILVDEVARSGSDLKRLRYRLTPIFATDPESQADIGRMIDLFAQGGGEMTPREEAVRVAGANRRRGWLRLRKAVIVALILADAALALWWFWPALEAPPVVSTAPVEATGTPDPPKPIPLDPRVRVSPDTEIRIGDPVMPPARPLLILGSALAPLAVAAAWYFRRRHRRRALIRAAGRRAIEPDGRLAESFAAQGIPLTDVAGEAAGRLGSVGQIEDSNLDAAATVRATTRAAGFFSPVHRRVAGAADYIVFIERRAPNDHLAKLVDDIFDRIEAAGVSIRRLYYADDPRYATEAGRSRPIGSLAAFADSLDAHRFLVVGSSDGFFHPLTGELLDWVRAFDTLTSRALLDARPPAQGGWRKEELIAAGFSIGDASPDGIAQYARVVAAGEDLGGGRVLDGRLMVAANGDAEPEAPLLMRVPFTWFHDKVAGAPTPEMIVLPAGTFAMGAPTGENEGSEDEGPQRLVQVAAFALARDPVTFEEYEAFCAATGHALPPSRERDRVRHPMVNVSWEDAQAYVTWLNGLVKGALYRLPTEAEWEYGCRAGTKTRYTFGSMIRHRQVRCAGWKDRNTDGTVSVDDLDASNVWGLRHMHGNVWEWVQDCWHGSYEGAPSDARAWLSEDQGDCGLRVVRGGSWVSDPKFVRSAVRFKFEPDFRASYLGFRIARTLTR